MENDEEVTLEPEEAQQDGTEAVVETEAEQETVEARLAKAEADAAKYRRLFEKAQKPKVETPQAPQPTPSNVEELILQNSGMSDELISELKIVAALRKVSLIKAQHDPIFVAVKEKIEKDKKREDASLPAARGAGATKPKKDLRTEGLTREEHMALAKSLG
jgi:hypothetical protein